MTDVWAAFVAARLDEDEAAAKAATPGPWHAAGEDILSRAGDPYWTGACAANAAGADAAHIARHDPARVLREVKAKRAIMAMWEHENMPSVYQPEPEVQELINERRDTIEMVLCEMAAVWSDHPDYRPEWTP